MVLLAEEEVRTAEVKGWRGLHLLHFGHSLCSRKCRVMLAEKGLEYTSRPVDLRAGENNGEWFMGINPRGLKRSTSSNHILVEFRRWGRGIYLHILRPGEPPPPPVDIFRLGKKSNHISTQGAAAPGTVYVYIQGATPSCRRPPRRVG